MILLALSTYYSTIEKKQLAEKMQKTYNEIRLIRQALYKFKSDTGKMPISKNGLMLLYRNTGISAWNGPYIQEEKLYDVWGSPYKYENHFEDNLPSFVASLGENKIWDTTEDDIRNKRAAKDDMIIWIE